MRTPNAGEDVSLLELSYTRGGSIKPYNHFRKWTVSYKVIQPPYILVIRLQREMKIYLHKKTCTAVFIASFLRIVKT